jgi:hypothetical protein
VAQMRGKRGSGKGGAWLKSGCSAAQKGGSVAQVRVERGSNQGAAQLRRGEAWLR